MDDDAYESMRAKIAEDRACVGIIGLGYAEAP